MSIRINRQILAKQIRVLDQEGNSLGVMATTAGMSLAEQEGKDLVEISPTANPPVCKIIEYSKYLYELKKATKQQKSPEVKEFRFQVNIDKHDLETKAAQIKKLLDKGHPIKLVVRFRGREIDRKENGHAVINSLKELLPGFTFNTAAFEEKQLISGIRP